MWSERIWIASSRNEPISTRTWRSSGDAVIAVNAAIVYEICLFLPFIEYRMNVFIPFLPFSSLHSFTYVIASAYFRSTSTSLSISSISLTYFNSEGKRYYPDISEDVFRKIISFRYFPSSFYSNTDPNFHALLRDNFRLQYVFWVLTSILFVSM